MIPQEKLNTDSSNPADNAEETVEVDLNENIEVEDSTGDVNIAAKLPPHGVYAVRWEPSKKDNAIYASKTKGDQHRAFVGAALAGTIQDEEFEGVMVFVNHINSLQRRGKPTSDLHHFLNVCGNPAPNKSTVGELLDFTQEVLDQKPVAMAELDWRAAFKDNDGNWKDLKVGMENFPKHYVDADGETATAKTGKWDGTYEQEIENPETGVKVSAQLEVKKHLTQAEANKLKSQSRSA